MRRSVELDALQRRLRAALRIEQASSGAMRSTRIGSNSSMPSPWSSGRVAMSKNGKPRCASSIGRRSPSPCPRSRGHVRVGRGVEPAQVDDAGQRRGAAPASSLSARTSRAVRVRVGALELRDRRQAIRRSPRARSRAAASVCSASISARRRASRRSRRMRKPRSCERRNTIVCWARLAGKGQPAATARTASSTASRIWCSRSGAMLAADRMEQAARCDRRAVDLEQAIGGMAIARLAAAAFWACVRQPRAAWASGNRATAYSRTALRPASRPRRGCRDDREHALDPVAAVADRLQIVADRLLARDFGDRADDRLEEARLVASVAPEMEARAGEGSI